MKKALVAILAFLYLAVASGVVMNTHYCMGRIASVDYGYKNQSSCGTCGMEQKDGCCHTDQKIIKLQDDQQVAKTGIDLVQLPSAAHVFSEHFVNFNYLSDRNYLTSYPHAPPDQRTNAVYLYNNVFRI